MSFKLLIIAILEFFYCTIVFAMAEIPPVSGKINQVIYITLDGVRWQDVYQTHQYFPKFWQKHANKFILYGEPSGTPMYTASTPISLPSYQSQMSGAVQPCDGNNCGRIKVETLPEYMINQFHIPKKKVAIFSSWPVIGYATEHVPGTTFSNTGNESVYDPDTLKPDKVMKKLNQKQHEDHPKDGADRYDRYTYAQAWHYFETYKPTFLWISFDHSDATAHAGDLEGYHSALSYYDEILDEILSDLQKKGIDKQTLVIVTTDHGRGDGKNWVNHGPKYPESRKIWAFVMNEQLVPIPQDVEKGRFSLLSIRPTIEKALGLDNQETKR